MLVDIHAHILPPGWEDFAARFGCDRWPWLDRLDACSANVMMGQRFFRKVTDQCWDLERRVADMDARGVAHQVVSPPPFMFAYWAPPEQGKAFARMQNEHIASFCARAPRRLSGMAVVPLQDPSLAIEELHHARNALGLRAVEIGTCPGGRDLDDPALFDFFTACVELDMAVFVHPGSPVLGDARLDRYYFRNLVGNPYESALAAANVVFGGVLQRLPKLRICFSHGCGGLCAILGRLRHGWRVRPEAKAVLACDPIEDFRRIFADTLAHDAVVVRALVEQLGPQGLMVGTDYPFGMGDADPGGSLAAMGLEPEDAASVAWRNALRFLNQPDPASLSIAAGG
ncbi:amidohydrolase family protein [Sabulicella rubraurantiaca]|uniref:amidohydrolase family protein n=1 Tax=Sabulicella rubraurantiaca TaxID=2811429 RepID=UPI001A9618E6|nr:amidohydrolase family protein [Sabulicella rubraurantiaca]